MRTEFVMDCSTGEVSEVTLAPLSLEERRAELLARVRFRRWQAETGGTNVGGTPIRTDEGSQAKISGAVALFVNDPTLQAIDWEAQPGVWVTLDAATMTAIGVAVGRHVQACFSNARAIAAQIEAASSITELDAIDLEAGWPV